MASLLARRSSVYSRGIPFPYSLAIGSKGGLIPFYTANQSIRAALLRTSCGGINYGPYESPHLRQSSTTTSIDGTPQPLDVIVNESIEAPVYIQHHLQIECAESRQKKALLAKRLTRTLTTVTKVYDFVTLPIYAAIQQPWKQMALHNAIKAITIDAEKQVYTSAVPHCRLHKELDEAGVFTMAKLYNRAIEQHGNNRALGVRDILGEEEIFDPSTGKLIKKYDLGEYSWKTYKEVDTVVQNLSRGFNLLNLKHKEKIAIFAETREEWFCTAMMAFKKNLPIVTVFTTLADEGVIHALTQTEVSTIITSEDLMPRCKEILKHVPQIKQLVYMEKSKFSTWDALEKLPNDVQVHTYGQLVAAGAELPPRVEDESLAPKPDDVAIIMYTSGSTGVPKGVMLSHKNLISGLKGSLDVTSLVGEGQPDDTYAAYLPLAHIMELMCESMTFIQGIPVGYSSPLTLTDKSPGVKDGCLGDASLIKPSVLPAVPLVVERICKGIKEKVSESGPVKEILFNFFIDYKISWKKLGYGTPLVDRIFFRKITSLVGGRMRYLVVGGAPLAPKTQEFISAALCCPVAIGYGMTETSSTGAMTLGQDLSVGRAGAPISCCYFKLMDWEDGGYRVTDKPFPRGEVYMGGDNVALGYFKRPDCKDFFEEDGKQWIRTGDIAEVHLDGVFKIIDRKKDLVKISTGKFVSLGKIESVLKVSPFVENICVYADSTKEYTVAMVVPSRIHVEKYAREMGIQHENYTDLCNIPLIREAILADIQEQGKMLNLHKYDIPLCITVCPEPWMPQSGMVTAAFKIKRSNVYKSYKAEIEEMYNSNHGF